MSFVAFSACAEVVVTFKHNTLGTIMKNVFGVRHTNAQSWTPGELSALGTAVNTWWSGGFRALCSNEISLTSVLCRDLSSEDSFVNEVLFANVGTLASPAMPANVTFALKFLTGLAGRSKRGRLYFIGLGESQVAGNFVGVTPATAMVTALNTLKDTTLPALTAQLVVLSRFHDGVQRETGLYTPVTTIGYTDLRVDTQRRRLA